ncbi:MAG TPA: EAL domain-containing protein [Polyangiaceae bacterium]|nr:EAL domain-containing protein [Polyangiaceae bacterium]
MDALASSDAADAPQRKRVLVVDDEPQVLLAMEDVLGEDYDVLKANSAAQVFDLLKSESDVAVVISDQRMPDMNGDELLGRLNGACDATRMMMTGYADLHAVIRAVNRGRIFAYVTKPWERDDLRAAVRKCAEQFDLQRTLERERQHLHDLMNSIPDAIYFKDRDLRLTRVNHAFAARAHLESTDAALGKRLSELAGGNIVDAVTPERAERAVLLERRPIADVTGEVETEEGRRFYSTTVAPVVARGGSVLGLVAVSRDVTARERTERALRRLTQIRTVLGGVNAAIVQAETREELFRECCRIAVEEGELLGAAVLLRTDDERLAAAACHRDSAAFSERVLAALRSGDATDPWSPLGALADGRRTVVRVPSGEAKSVLGAEGVQLGPCVALGMFPLCFHEELMGILTLASEQEDLFDGEEGRLLRDLAHNIAFAIDHFDKDERLKFLACYDDLTGLPRRELLLDRVGQLLAGRASVVERIALVIVDVTRFRHVNDTLGRGAGDELLRQLARRLAGLLDRGDTLARFDGNSFALVMASNEGELTTWMERELFPSLGAPFMVRGTELRITVRAGVAIFPSDGETGEELLRNAEAALANARARGQRSLFYAPSMNARVSEKLNLATRLRRALEEEQFLLHYQPEIDLRSGALVAVEALIRWEDPERGLVSPGDFIPVLEETGLIVDVGQWVLRTAAAQFASWKRARLCPPPIAINVSALQLAERGFVRSVEDVFGRYPLARGGLDLEITESVFLYDLANSIEKLKAIRALGVRIAIDDFGTGYSSLGYLNRLPVDALKIDQSFVRRMADDPQDMSIVTTLISLAHALNLKIVAEGVETEEQALLLKLLKCDLIQGYWVGRPRSAGDITALFARESPSQESADATDHAETE